MICQGLEWGIEFHMVKVSNTGFHMVLQASFCSCNYIYILIFMIRLHTFARCQKQCKEIWEEAGLCMQERLCHSAWHSCHSYHYFLQEISYLSLQLPARNQESLRIYMYLSLACFQLVWPFKWLWTVCKQQVPASSFLLFLCLKKFILLQK